jgi:AcrR family transcriptional regulator
LTPIGRESNTDVDPAIFESGVMAGGKPLSPRAADSRTRVIDAALRCVARFGVSKTTVDDIARESRLSRATLYRLFPGGREEIVFSMVERELSGFFAEMARRLDGVETLEYQLVVAMVTAAEAIVTHEALGFVMAYEPELLLPHVSFSEFDGLLSVASSFLAPYLLRLLEAEDARRVGEWITRLVISHVVCPPGALQDAWSAPRSNSSRGSGASRFAVRPEPLPEARARWLVATFVMPGIRALVSQSASTAASVPAVSAAV